MKCSKCGTDNPSGAVCSKCGSILIERLPENEQQSNNNSIASFQPQNSPPQAVTPEIVENPQPETLQTPTNPFISAPATPPSPIEQQVEKEKTSTPADPSNLAIPNDFKFSDEPEEEGDDMDSIGVKIDDSLEETKKKKKNYKRIRRKIRKIIKTIIITGLILFIIYYVIVHYIMPNDFIFGFFK